MTPAGIELATFRFVAQHLNHCTTSVPRWSGRKQANVSVRRVCISFRALPCKGEKLDSSRLDVVEIARVPDMLPSLFPSWLG